MTYADTCSVLPMSRQNSFAKLYEKHHHEKRRGFRSAKAQVTVCSWENRNTAETKGFLHFLSLLVTSLSLFTPLALPSPVFAPVTSLVVPYLPSSPLWNIFTDVIQAYRDWEGLVVDIDQYDYHILKYANLIPHLFLLFCISCTYLFTE